MRRYLVLSALPLIALTMTACSSVSAASADLSAKAAAPAPTYPATPRQDVVDAQFGVDVADPYRWLEDDVRVNPKVAEWVAAQNAVTNDVLATLPGRDVLKERMTQLYDYERFKTIVKSKMVKKSICEMLEKISVRIKEKERVLWDSEK